MNKKNIFQILLITGCLSLICLLGACNEEDDIVNNQVIINGNTAILTFTVGESDFDSEQINTRSTVPNDTVRQELGDGYVIETVIVPDTVSALTRAITSTTNTVRDRVKILVIAYRGENLYKREVATVENGKFAIHLPPGETFKLLFYSHNEPNQPAPTEYCSSIGWKPSTNTSESGEGSYLATDGATINVVENEKARDMMWATANVTVTSTTRLEEINFKHLFCKVILNVTCDDDMTALTAVISPKAFSNAKVDISVDPNEENNHRWVGMGTLKETKIESTTTGGAKQLGGQTDLIPNESENITLGYEKITIFGQDYKTTTPKDLGLIFTRGHRYIMTSKVKKDDLVTITYHPNGGTGDDMMLQYKRGTNIVLPEDTFVPPLENVLYTWNTQSDGTGQDYENGTTLTLTSNIELYAIWKNPCVPTRSEAHYFWDAKKPYPGYFDGDDAKPHASLTATYTAKLLPSWSTLEEMSAFPVYSNTNRDYPRFIDILGDEYWGGAWVANPKHVQDIWRFKSKWDKTSERPSNKYLCDYYIFFPNVGTYSGITWDGNNLETWKNVESMSGETAYFTQDAGIYTLIDYTSVSCTYGLYLLNDDEKTHVFFRELEVFWLDQEEIIGAHFYLRTSRLWDWP